MRFNALNRKLHYWASAVVALPVLVILCSGILLQVKKHWSWVQPEKQRGTGTEPAIDLDGILESVRSAPELGVSSWEDVRRIDVRPGRGMAKVSLANGFEAQVDLGTGRLLQSASRRSDLIESIHDGSFLAGEWTKLGVFLPTGVLLLGLWATGMWLFWMPFAVRRRRKREASAALPSLR